MVITVGMLRVDEPRSVASLGGAPLGLRPLDVRVLAELARRPGQAISRRTLADTLWGPGAAADQRTFDTSVVRIRKALCDRGRAIVTIRRVGYRLDPQVLER